MDTNPLARLAQLGFQLPPVSPPKGTYIPAVRSKDLVFVAGQIPMQHGELIRTGKVGDDVTVAQARELTERCVLAALAAVHEEAGLDRVSQVVKMVGYVRSARDFTDQAKVMDAASELLVAVFGDAGRHARTSIGVSELPLGSPVEVELTVEIGA